jgi:aspartate aminotransferase
MLLSDEIYEHILFDGADFISFGQACPALLDRTIIRNGVSKAYAMTGWRIGYGAGPKDLIKAMGKVQSQSTTNPCSIAQAGAVAALNGPQNFVGMCAKEFEARRNLVVEGINQIEGLEVSAPAGAFYAFIHSNGVIGKTTASGEAIESDADFAQYLLNEGHVASVPGVAYGLEPYFRISTALSRSDLAEAVSRIEKAVSALQG